MGLFNIIGLAVLLAILICFCYCCTRACKRKPETRRKRRRQQQKNARRKRRRHQRNGSAPAPPSTNPQTRIQIVNPSSQQTNTPSASVPSSVIQAELPHQQYSNVSSPPYLQFHNQQYLNLVPQSQQNEQFILAQQQVPHIMAQQGDLYPFPPPPYEPPEQLPTQRQGETRVTMPGLDVNQFARPPPPPYDEELQRAEPFKLN